MPKVYREKETKRKTETINGENLPSRKVPMDGNGRLDAFAVSSKAIGEVHPLTKGEARIQEREKDITVTNGRIGVLL